MKKYQGKRVISKEQTDDPTLLSAINKMQQQLEYLERKIDTLIRQTPGGNTESPSGRYQSKSRSFHSDRSDKKPFKKPFGSSSFGKPRARDEKKSDSRSGSAKPKFMKNRKKLNPDL